MRSYLRSELVLWVVGRLLLPPSNPWLSAMLGELAVISGRRARARFVAGACVAVARLAGRRWLEPSPAWLGAIALGAAVPLVDTHDAAPCLLLPMTSLTVCALTLLVPAAPWRWAVGTLVGLSAGSMLGRPPDFLDRADLTSLIVALLVFSFLTACLARLIGRPRSPSLN